MKRIALTFGTLILAAALFFTGTYTSIELVAYRDTFYQKQYEKNRVVEATGISEEELMRITDEMQLFLQGKRDNFNIIAVVNGTEQSVFTQNEQSHMMDVQQLFIRYRTVRNFAVVVILCCAVFLIFRRFRVMVIRMFRNAAIIVLSCFAILAVCGLFFFEPMFLAFHHIFFSNMNWTFSIYESVLINMLPESFFIACAVRIAIYNIIFLSVTAVGFGIVLRTVKNKQIRETL